MPGLRLPPLLPGRVDSGHPHLACFMAHCPARLLPGAILKLPVWGDAAAENCFEDDIYWEVRRGAGGLARPRAEALRRGVGSRSAAGAGRSGAGGTRWRCRPAA